MEALKELPSVDQVLRALRQTNGLPHHVIVAEIRAVLAEQRERLKAGGAASEIERMVEERLAKLAYPSLRGVINATGVMLHTNLGPRPFIAFQPLPGYSNLEYDLAAGKRGKRDTHTAHLLEKTDRPSGDSVNNNAAAVFLVLHELAAGQEVIVSRGELIEIGDGFRIPEIMARFGSCVARGRHNQQDESRGLSRGHQLENGLDYARASFEFSRDWIHGAPVFAGAGRVGSKRRHPAL
jgi:L-seryl-tRNA(Ser) seleniumtransferase